MRIGIHAGTLRGAGSSSVGKNLVRELAILGHAHDLVAWLPAEWSLDAGAIDRRLTRARVGEKARLEFSTIPRAIRREGLDRLLSLGDTSTPRPGIPHVLFVQQALLAYPQEEWGFDAPRRFRSKFALMSAYFRLGAKGVSRFVVQTEDMRVHLARHFEIALDRIVVIPSAVANDVRELAQVPYPTTDAAPYVCYVSNAGPHKNHAVLVEMMAALASDHPDLSCKLTIGRGELPELEAHARRLGVLQRFEFLGVLDRAQALELLRGARVAVIPSVLESFGIVYYEALALGRPIVAADRGFAREACGDAGRYARADDSKQWAERVHELLMDGQRVAELARARFTMVDVSWSEIAARFMRSVEES